MNIFKTTVTSLLLMCSVTSNSKVTAEQAAKLNNELTPFGAKHFGDEKAGIPAWQDVTEINPNEQPLFAITHSNYQQYQKHLTAGQIALFKAYPKTFEMPIYPSHRTFSAPDWVYENTKKNAISTTLNEAQTGILNTVGGIPFPIPNSALEVYFNHIARWRGQQLHSFASDATINADGKFHSHSRETLIRFDHYLNDKVTGIANPNRLFSAVSKITSPATKSGNGGLVLEPIDQFKEPRSAWLYDKGRRRVTRAPNFSYDQPINTAGGLLTADDTDMVNGSPDRFNWTLLESRNLYIPYNNNRLANQSLTYKDILHTGHLNPENTRYEMHRVWVVRATIKSDWRHLYSQRDFYIDEDSWSIVIADQYDKQGQLFRVSMAYLQQDPKMPGTFPVVNAYHDLNSRKYHVMGLQNEAPKGKVYDAKITKDSLFTPSGLKRFVK